MVMSKKAVLDLVADRLYPAYAEERERLNRIDYWYRWKQEDIPLPRRATPELRRLAELSKTPWLSLVVGTIAQCLYVDGFRTKSDSVLDSDEKSPSWETWHANGWDQRQIAIHRSALAYGYSFATVLPGEDHAGKRSVMRGVSPRKMYAVYEDPAEDDWPIYALKADAAPKGKELLKIYDSEFIYHVEADTHGGKPNFISYEVHGADVCPVIRYANQLDLDGRCTGEVEPFIANAKRINKTAYDRLLTQHFASWKVRTISGMAEPDDEESANRKKLDLRQDDILVAEDPDTKFGTLDATPLDGFINAHRNDVETLAAVSQTPTHALTGDLVNLSAEALAAARAGLTQRVYERQRSFGKSHVQSLRLAAQLEGRWDDAQDMFARVTWQDMEIRSMSQAVDALGKAATLLGVPQVALWQRIPGIEKADVDEWREMAAEDDPINQMTETLMRQSQGSKAPLLNSSAKAPPEQ
jgi:hypothetical protein